MSKLIAARTGQYVMEAEFTFNFDDTMVSVGGTEVDFGKTNTAATSFDIINLPENSVIVGGELVTETAFDTASYAVVIGDSATADRYLASADRKGAARVALVPTGYRTTGANLRIGITNADACTAGKATVRVQYVITGRANEMIPN